MTDDTRHRSHPANEASRQNAGQNVDVTLRGVPIEEDLVWMARRGASEIARVSGEPARCSVVVERATAEAPLPVRARVSFEIAGLHAAHESGDWDARRALARAIEGLQRQLGLMLAAGSA